MNEIVLMIFFNINGAWTTHPDFMPIPVENMLVCQERRQSAEEYFNGLDDFPEFEVSCYRRMVGVPM